LVNILTIQAQLVNVNPDKTAEAWWVGGLRLPSDEELAAIPVLKPIDPSEKVLDLPSSLDNSENAYFRPVFNQADGSCAQSSGIGYTFTYEMNCLRDTPANITSNQYPSHYTYNFLNDGSGDNGSWYVDGWEIVKANGCPTVQTYGGMSINARYWMSDYDKYEASMGVRVKDYFSINVGTPEGLETLKSWMYDHMEGDETGGIVNFAAGASGEFYMTYDDIVVEWGHDVNHAMTFVGWDDSITYDYNDDGLYTNNVDINGDGLIDMRDWEKGALIMVNTWGDYFGDGGKAYVMYKTLADGAENGGIFNSTVYGIHVEEVIEPELLLRVKMKHPARNKIKVFAGLSTDVTRNTPTKVVLFPFFSFQGGGYSMRGTGSQAIEFSVDISKLLEGIETTDDVKIFLVIKENDSADESEGEIIDFSIVDKNGTEYFCDEHNKSIENSSFTFMSIVSSLALSNGVSTMDKPIKIYPNPVRGELNIDVASIEIVELYDSMGRLVYCGTGSVIDTSIYNKGVYNLHVINHKGQSFSERLVVE